MASSRAGRELLISKLQSALSLPTKRDAEAVLDKVIICIEDTLIENLDTDQFSMKLNSFCKLSVKHKPGIVRKIPFTGEIKRTDDKRKIRFVSLGRLRQLEKKETQE